MSNFYDQNNVYGQSANSPSYSCLCVQGLPCPAHHPPDGAAWHPPPTSLPRGPLVGTDGLSYSSQSQFMGPTSYMIGPTGYRPEATVRNYNGSLHQVDYVGEMSAPHPTSLPNVSSETIKSRIYCDVPGCDKSYTAAHNLKYHKLVHDGIKPYLCDKCRKPFRSHSDRTRHQKKSKTPCKFASRS